MLNLENEYYMHLLSWCINKRNFSVAICSFFLYKNWIIICRDLWSPKSIGSFCCTGNLISNIKTLYSSKEDISDVSFDVSLSVVSCRDRQTFTFVMNPMNKNIYTTSVYFQLLYFIYSYNHIQTSRASELSYL
jgi:hypothetical protein